MKSSLPQCYRDPSIKNTHTHTLESRLRASQSRFQDLASKTPCADSGKQVDSDSSQITKILQYLLFLPIYFVSFPKVLFLFIYFFNLFCCLNTKTKSNRKLQSQHQSGTEPGYVNWFVVPKVLEEQRKKFLLLKLGPHPYVSIVFFYLYN